MYNFFTYCECTITYARACVCIWFCKKCNDAKIKTMRECVRFKKWNTKWMWACGKLIPWYEKLSSHSHREYAQINGAKSFEWIYIHVHCPTKNCCQYTHKYMRYTNIMNKQKRHTHKHTHTRTHIYSYNVRLSSHRQHCAWAFPANQYKQLLPIAIVWVTASPYFVCSRLSSLLFVFDNVSDSDTEVREKSNHSEIANTLCVVLCSLVRYSFVVLFHSANNNSNKKNAEDEQEKYKIKAKIHDFHFVLVSVFHFVFVSTP